MAAFLVALAPFAHADEVAVSFDISREPRLGAGQGVYGWQFTVNSDIKVQSLGIYDNPYPDETGSVGDGLLESHVVSIWDVSDPSIPLVSAATPPGTSAPLRDGFRYVGADHVALRSGHDYVVAATYHNVPSPPSADTDFATGSLGDPGFVLTVGPSIAFGGYRSITNYTGSLVFPEHYFPGKLYAFGPNFTYTSVPEPPTITLAIIAAGVLLGLQRSRLIPLAFFTIPRPIRLMRPEKLKIPRPALGDYEQSCKS